MRELTPGMRLKRINSMDLIPREECKRKIRLKLKAEKWENIDTLHVNKNTYNDNNNKIIIIFKNY